MCILASDDFLEMLDIYVDIRMRFKNENESKTRKPRVLLMVMMFRFHRHPHMVNSRCTEKQQSLNSLVSLHY